MEVPWRVHYPKERYDLNREFRFSSKSLVESDITAGELNDFVFRLTTGEKEMIDKFIDLK